MSAALVVVIDALHAKDSMDKKFITSGAGGV